MKKVFCSLIMAALLVTVAHATNITGRFGKQNSFSGRFPLTGGIGTGGAPPPSTNFLLANTGSTLLVNTGVKFLVQ